MSRSRHSPRLISRLLAVFSILFSSFPGVLSSRVVTLGSIEIFKTHEWISPKPTVYFYCQGENKTILPDVKEKTFLYTFKGEESWQPLTELPDKKCKRCGLYEINKFRTDDIFDEWELCPDDFVDGKYMHYKEKELNATFICPECNASTISSIIERAEKKLNISLAVIIGILVSAVVVAGALALHKYWKKRKRQQDQARFLKLFEESDDLDDLNDF
ncbi:uncharacterized protein A4U43_C08F34460 [Asparagus officinalis]|uniref:uncharacterized protein LOC109820204 n=1 Tax=Asparagus officinalis TaxID=4686 RepID=UPI00098E4E9F|nr:uncharacterized protein LOC109820204 [Asparagus officinalis]ONK61873.1 uncharacterized protein A4U43_C08F34460 [Asparagus officinalis]